MAEVPGLPAAGGGPEAAPEGEWYQICLRESLSDRWMDWFDGFTLTQPPGQGAVLFGRVADQAALHGVLIAIRDLGLTLLSVQRMDPG
jgi:hypothetical protein